MYTECCDKNEVEKKQGWFMNILVALDQLGNALSRGNPDNTISARIGYFNYGANFFDSSYWKVIEKIVNFTFKPIDGIDHCKMAYYSDMDEEFVNVDYISDILLFFFVLGPCIPLIPIIWVVSLIIPSAKTKYYINGEQKSLKEINLMREKEID